MATRFSYYRRPDGGFYYRPDGVSRYVRPIGDVDNDILFAPRRGDPAVEGNLAAASTQTFFEETERLVNKSKDEIDILELQVAALQAELSSIRADLAGVVPSYSPITNADSPYQAKKLDYILADMSAGDVTIVLPGSGRVAIHRKGASNTLTITGTVNGTVNPTIVGDGSIMNVAYMTEWRDV